ncbi:MAG: NOB1 family endonuclease [Archaeoglobaceae archaeon]|nr:NOB1 family endonuclease [Archaeoglobales archaeon]MDI9642497.1 NOB1 family endonuclease [Archaeoglobales archaeon]
MRIYVLDSTAIFQRKAVYENMVTVPEVVSEILDENSSLYFSVKELRVENASEKNFRFVEEISKKTGDIYRLSETDLKILAKALDEKEKGNEIVLVTDDYSIQNVAMALGINFESVIHAGISKGFKWVRVCRGCGRKIDSEVCPICGCEAVLRKVKR